MDWLIQNFTTVMIATVVLVVVISQIHRLAGSVLGFFAWVLLAIVGTGVYERGGQIGLPGAPFSLNAFYGFCAVLALLNVVSAVLHHRRQRGGAPDGDE